MYSLRFNLVTSADHQFEVMQATSEAALAYQADGINASVYVSVASEHF